MSPRNIFQTFIIIAMGVISVSNADEERAFEIRIEHRAVAAPSEPIRVTEGSTVILRWHTDEAVTLHLHGYDIEIQAGPDTPVETRLKATATGRFPVTSHGFNDEHDHDHKALLYLEVYPQ